MGILTSLVKEMPVVGQATGLARTAGKVYNATSPAAAVCAAVEGVLLDCTPPVIKYPLKCTALGIQILIFATTAGNPVTGPMSAALVLGQMTSIIEEKLI